MTTPIARPVPIRRPSLRPAALLSVLVALVACLGLTTAPAQAAPSCAVTWGSLAKNGSAVGRTDLPGHDLGGVAGVRAGRHACHDRLVIDLRQPGTSWSVRYVDRVRQPGSGHVVPTAGGARLQVSVDAAEYVLDPITGAMQVPYKPRDRSAVAPVRGFDTFRQVTYAGSFEGQHVFGLGVRARLPFRVFHLEGPGDRSRLVIDVAHRWR